MKYAFHFSSLLSFYLAVIMLEFWKVCVVNVEFLVTIVASTTWWKSAFLPGRRFYFILTEKFKKLDIWGTLLSCFYFRFPVVTLSETDIFPPWMRNVHDETLRLVLHNAILSMPALDASQLGRHGSVTLSAFQLYGNFLHYYIIFLPRFNAVMLTGG